jgi:hypothetical protein
MALGTTYISVSAIQAETGLTDDNWTDLVGAAGLNKYSFYAPGQLSVDGASDVVLTPPTVNLRLGDFRLYNHTANTPAAQTNYTQNWGPAAGDFNFTIAWYPQNMNIKAFAVPGDYLTVNAYESAVNRTNEASVIFTQTTSITFSAVSPTLTDHSRTKANPDVKASSTSTVQLTAFPYAYVLVEGTIIYFETFISDMYGARKINLGVRANGYTDITFHRSVMPYVHGQVTSYPTPPANYTFITANAYDAARCTTTGVNQSLGTSYSFNLVAYALYNDGGGNIYRTVRLPVCYAKLTVDGVDTILLNGTELADTGQSCSGTLTGGTFNYDDIGVVTFTVGTTVDGGDFIDC